MKAKLKGGDEYDCFTIWRKVCIWRAGDRRKIKTRFNRRLRRVAHLEQMKESAE